MKQLITRSRATFFFFVNNSWKKNQCGGIIANSILGWLDRYIYSFIYQIIKNFTSDILHAFLQGILLKNKIIFAKLSVLDLTPQRKTFHTRHTHTHTITNCTAYRFYVHRSARWARLVTL